MSKLCAVCGKSTMAVGHRRHNTTSNISRHGGWGHRAPRIATEQKPNLRKALISDGDVVRKEWVCMKCYKKAAK